LPQERRIGFRVGINLADIVVQGDDIPGDGVNIDARLEAVAEPGSICLSEDAFRQVRGKVAAEFTDMGEQSLKNDRKASP
jgi:class 3 adenylate cyclase